MYEFFINTLVVLLVVIDPVGVAPIFAALTHDSPASYKKLMALKGTLIATGILLVFTISGKILLDTLGISVNAFRIAGGFLLFLLSIDMVFARHTGLRSTTESETAEAGHRADISVFPLSIPLLAGPGAMTTLLLLMGETEGDGQLIAVLFSVLLLVMLSTFIALRMATQLMNWIGETGANVVSRVLGVLLAALAVQYMIDGIQRSFLN